MLFKKLYFFFLEKSLKYGKYGSILLKDGRKHGKCGSGGHPVFMTSSHSISLLGRLLLLHFQKFTHLSFAVAAVLNISISFCRIFIFSCISAAR